MKSNNKVKSKKSSHRETQGTLEQIKKSFSNGKINKLTTKQCVKYTKKNKNFNLSTGRSQDDDVHGIIVGISNEVQKHFRHHKYKLPKTIDIAQKPNGEFNAGVKLNHNHELESIFINDGVTLFIWLFSKIIASYLSLEKKGKKIALKLEKNEIEKNIKNNEKGNIRFQALLSSYILHEDPKYGMRFPLSYFKSDQIVIASIITNMMEAFIMTHELSHIALRHTESNMQNEFEADTLAFLMLNEYRHHNYADNYDISFGLISVILLFTVHEIIDDIKKKMGRNVKLETHPTPYERKKHLLKFIKENFISYYNGCLQPTKYFEYLLKKIWLHNKEAFYNVYPYYVALYEDKQ